MITSANVACGYHASDPVVMMETIQRAKEAGIAVGAHPGLPDLMGFGRRSMAISNEEAKAYTLYQISAIGGMCKAAGVKLQHVNHTEHYIIWQLRIMICLKRSAKHL